MQSQIVAFFFSGQASYSQMFMGIRISIKTIKIFFLQMAYLPVFCQGLPELANGFLNSKSRTNADSAYYFVQRLEVFPETLEDLIHDDFAQIFIPPQKNTTIDSTRKKMLAARLAFGNEMLHRMYNSSSPLIRKIISPVWYWVNISANKNGTEINHLAKEFIATIKDGVNIYKNRMGRYMLLVHQIISEKDNCKEESRFLFDYVYDSLHARLTRKTISDPAQANRYELGERAWTRYLYAYCNYLKATVHVNNSNIKKAADYFRLASDYSPDLTDQNSRSYYFYDAFFLWRENKESFQDDYYYFLVANDYKKKDILKVLLDMAMADPGKRKMLELYYNQAFKRVANFEDFWDTNLKKRLKKAPEIRMELLGGGYFLSLTDSLSDKWILLDFWGTWCLPCREEHPRLQKFYDEVIKAKGNKIELLTIACKDEKGKVEEYMKQLQYSFPVAMSDNEIENSLHVTGYPSKYLITPSRRIIIIPFGIDWAKFIKQVCGL